MPCFPLHYQPIKFELCLWFNAEDDQDLVHVYPELSSPLSDPQCEGRVEPYSAEGDPGVLLAAGEGQGATNQGELHQGGSDVEDQGGQHEADPTRPSVYGLGECPCLAV